MSSDFGDLALWCFSEKEDDEHLKELLSLQRRWDRDLGLKEE